MRSAFLLVVGILVSGATWLEMLGPPPPVRAAFGGVVPIEIIIREFRNLGDGAGGKVEQRLEGTGFLVAPALMVTATHLFVEGPGNKGAMQFLPSRNGATRIETSMGPGQFIHVDRMADLAIYRLDSPAAGATLALRPDPPARQELLWWYCVRGLLSQEWSVGRFLDTIPPAGSLQHRYSHPLHLVNAIVGGVHPGCSGAPVFDAEGRVIGMISGFLDGGSFLSVLVIRAEDILAALPVR